MAHCEPQKKPIQIIRHRCLFSNRMQLNYSRTPLAAANILLLLMLPVVLNSASGSDTNDPPLLLQNPSLSRNQIVFNFAGNLWIVGREGGDARRLTTGNHEREPYFSPDGSWVAFTGEY